MPPAMIHKGYARTDSKAKSGNFQQVLSDNDKTGMNTLKHPCHYLEKKPSSVERNSLAPSDLGIVMNMKAMAARRKYISAFSSWKRKKSEARFK